MMNRHKRYEHWLVLAAVIMTFGCGAGFRNEGFGQNVVRYDDFDFKILPDRTLRYLLLRRGA